MSDDELKPCPFCGCTDIRFVPSGWMRCAGCMTRGPTDDTDWPNDKAESAKKEAIRLWNRRLC
jgi:Lar family restriction alleviation protein